jgi:hypothetical protein
MKFFKLFFLFSFLQVLSLQFRAQGNLQFNQVKLVSSQETVPANKVWKVESATFFGGTPICLGSGPNAPCAGGNLIGSGFLGEMAFNINGQTNYIYSNFGQPNSSASYSSVGLNPFPLWLPAGSTLAAGTNMRFLSVIEFNIIP